MDQIGKGILRKRLTRIAARTNPYFDSIERPRGFNNIYWWMLVNR